MIFIFMSHKLIISEEEKQDITNQYENIDRKLLNFLIRRVDSKENYIGKQFKDFEPLKVTEYVFKDLPGYGFNSFNSKKEMERAIINMLYENDFIGEEIYDIKNVLDTDRQKIIKTIRKFLNFILQK
jgi:hypothetical protein